MLRGEDARDKEIERWQSVAGKAHDRIEELEKKVETHKRVREQLQKELNQSGSGRGEWHVAHSCVPKQQYLQLEERYNEWKKK